MNSLESFRTLQISATSLAAVALSFQVHPSSHVDFVVTALQETL